MSPHRNSAFQKGLLGAVSLILSLIVDGPPGAAQWYTPQSDRDLRVRWVVESVGTSQVLVQGDIQNRSGFPARRVVLRAEGLDGSGKVVSRARGYVSGDIPARGSASFTVRLSLTGLEQTYLVTIDSFEFLEPSRRGESHSP
jgi:hypothetical protein